MQVDLLEKIANTRKRKEKEELLRQADERTKTMIRYALDPTEVFYVTRKSETADIKNPSNTFWDEFEALLKGASNGTDDPSEKIEDVLASAPNQKSVKWAVRVLNKNLKAGLAEGTVNKVFPGLITSFSLPHPTTFDASKHLPLKGEWHVEPKKGGMRVVILEGRAYTRNGKPLKLDPVLEELSKSLDLNECVVDGEVTANDATPSELGQMLNNGQADKATYYVHDLIFKDFWKSKNTRELYKRKSTIEKLLRNGDYVKIVPWYNVPRNCTEKDLRDYIDVFAESSYKGCYLRNVLSQYFAERDEYLRLD